jgi:hypothetical protein
MVYEVNLKERFFDVRKEEEKEKTVYEDNVDPMKDSINEFVEKLKNYCSRNNIADVRIFYKVMYESIPEFSRKGTTGYKVIIQECYYNEVEDAWLKLLNRWYFSKNGTYLLPAIKKAVNKKGFAYEYDYEGWGLHRSMVHFTLI